jgi:hypothetical protein
MKIIDLKHDGWYNLIRPVEFTIYKAQFLNEFKLINEFKLLDLSNSILFQWYRFITSHVYTNKVSFIKDQVDEIK